MNENKKTKKQNKKVVILGTAPSIKDAPFDDPTFDIWGVAHCCFLPECKKLDEIYELHLEPIWRNDWKGRGVPFARFPDAKVYMVDNYPDINNCVRFPIEDIKEKYGNYWTNSPAFMIALAIERGYEEIHVYGIHFLQDEEFFFQRPCFEYYLGIAVGRGIKIFMAEAADILKFSHIYGYEDVSENVTKSNKRIEEFDTRGNQFILEKNKVISSCNNKLSIMEGGKQMLQHIKKVASEFKGKDKENWEAAMAKLKEKFDMDNELKQIELAFQDIVAQRNNAVSKLDANVQQLIGAKENEKYHLKIMGDCRHMLSAPKIEWDDTKD
jgi:hypothetical protein